MEAYQISVIGEKASLDEKLRRLNAFIAGAQFLSLPSAEQERMMRQAQIMLDYSNVLSDRIAAF